LMGEENYKIKHVPNIRTFENRWFSNQEMEKH
jgi:hypothetical protein